MKDTSKYVKTSPKWLTLEEISKGMQSGGFLSYDNLGVDLGNKHDLTHVLYLDVKKGRGREGMRINPDSYRAENSRLVVAIFEQLASLHQKGRAHPTMHTILINITYFLMWTKKEGLMPIENIQKARVLYEQYVLYIKSRMRMQGKMGWGSRAAHNKQKAAREFLGYLFGEDKENYIAGGIRKIAPKKEKNTISDDEDVAYALNFYYKFFDCVADFVLNKNDYPLNVQLPGESLWVFPSFKYWTDKGNAPRAFDYENGKVLRKEEVLSCLPVGASESTKGSAINSWKKVTEVYEEANRDKESSEYRIFLADKALMAYFMVLLAVTGTNDSTMALMPWSDEFDEASEVQHFKTIKPRAGHKNVRFEIQKEFMPSFKKFLKLRDYALQGREWDYLFFRAVNGEIRLSAKQKIGVFGQFIYDTIFKSLDSSLPYVGSRKFRASKTRWVYDEYGLWAASIMAQSSVPTILGQYSNESAEEQDRQMSDYFEQMHNKMTDAELCDTSAGGCSNIDNPNQEVESENHKADCKNPIGCLFCSHYGYHPDSHDARKLYSIQYLVTEALVVNARDAEHFESVMGPLLKRIASIFESIKSVGPEAQKMLEEVERDVYVKQNLHPYWEAKMMVFYDLGVVR